MCVGDDYAPFVCRRAVFLDIFQLPLSHYSRNGLCLLGEQFFRDIFLPRKFIFLFLDRFVDRARARGRPANKKEKIFCLNVACADSFFVLLAAFSASSASFPMIHNHAGVSPRRADRQQDVNDIFVLGAKGNDRVLVN